MQTVFKQWEVELQALTQEDVKAKLSEFTREIFIHDAEADPGAISCRVILHNPGWILNDHFPGTSIIQCFYQSAQLLFYENDESFDPAESLFFSGGIKVKFLNPIFEGDQVMFTLTCERFMQNVLLFEGTCVDLHGKVYAKASGSLSSQKRVEVSMRKLQSNGN